MMLKSREDLVAAALERDRNIARAQARFERNIEQVFDNYTTRFRLLLSSQKEMTKSERFELAVAMKMASDLERIMAESGRDDLVADYVENFQALTKNALNYFGDIGEDPGMGGIDRQALESLIRFNEQTLLSTIDRRMIEPLREGIFQNVFGAMSREQVVVNLSAKVDYLTHGQLTTLVNDSIAQYSRTVTVEKGEDLGLELFIYQGPTDSKTSPQCTFLLEYDKHGVPGLFYKDEISADLHEDLVGNPLINGGHPNCRHEFLPITLSFAKSLGFEP